MIQRPLLMLGLLLALLWGAGFSTIQWLRSQKPTAAKLSAQVEKTRLEGRSAEQRRKSLDQLADQLNRLEFEERQQLRQTRKMDVLFQQMTETERLRFLDQTLPVGFKEIMDSFNAMSSEERKKRVNLALEEMRRRQSELPPEEIRNQVTPEAINKMVGQGLQSYFRDRTAETKMDLAPLIEEIQINLRNLRP